MKVKLLMSRTGITISQLRGDVIEVDAEEGKRMIKAGQAVAVSAKPEKATRKTVKEKRDQA